MKEDCMPPAQIESDFEYMKRCSKHIEPNQDKKQQEKQKEM